jgi:DNA-binding MarR family transcriptional regulator
VLNPYAPYLTFPDDRLSARRDHGKYLGLIRAVAFARQQQRKVVDGAVSVTLEDITLANRLAHHALGQSLYDLTPPSRRLLMEIREWLTERGKKDAQEPVAVRFTQRELREHVGWKKSQLAEHLKELIEAEYLLAMTGGSQGRRTVYRLDWDGQGLSGERFYSGLVDAGKLSGCLPGAFREGPGKRKRAPKSPEKPENGDSAGASRLSGEGIER